MKDNVTELIAALEAAIDSDNQTRLAATVEAICERFEIPRQFTPVGGADADSVCRCAQLLLEVPTPLPVDKCVHILLDAAYAQAAHGASTNAIAFAEKAIDWPQKKWAK